MVTYTGKVSVAPRPSPSPYVPSPLSEAFTSDLHGFSVSYPTGWATQQATQPWQTATPITWGEPFGDFVFEHLLNTAVQEQTIFDNLCVTDWELSRYFERG